MRSKRWLWCAVATVVLATPALADELKMTSPPSATADRPSRGMSMEKVEATYGSPARRVAPVGEPPITRWEYPGFVVYFEHNLVIHTVVAS